MFVLSKNKILLILIILLAIVFIFSGCSLKSNEKNDVSIISSIDTTAITETNETPKQDNLSEEKIIPIKEPEKKLLPEEEIMQKRIQLENSLKTKLGKFYVPLAPLEVSENPAIKAKGIYVTANSAGFESRFNSFIDMIEKTELNAMVIDVKNDWGLMTYPSEIEIVKEIMKDTTEPVRDIKSLMSRLDEENIYPIARIVVFRDPQLPKFYPEWAIKKKDGTIFKDDKGFIWLNPYEKKVWDYNIAIAKEAALMGFREIQFDYLRFPDDSENFDLQVVFPDTEGIPKDDIIKDFIIYAAEQLKDYNVYVSADVFGVTATYLTDKDEIGQNWEKITNEADYIYPMVYPSHYNAGFFGFDVPDAMPKETIIMALSDAVERNATIKNPACIRPWLQGFTATWIKGNINYGPVQIREQIEAALECGIEEFFIWNASNQYDPLSFITEKEALQKQQQASNYRTNMGLDFIGNTSFTALEKYLGNISKEEWNQVYPYHATDFKMNLKQFSDWADSWTFDSMEFSIISNYKNNNSISNALYEANIILKKGTDKYVIEKESFEVFIENNIWKIKPELSFIELLSTL